MELRGEDAWRLLTYLMRSHAEIAAGFATRYCDGAVAAGINWLTTPHKQICRPLPVNTKG